MTVLLPVLLVLRAVAVVLLLALFVTGHCRLPMLMMSAALGVITCTLSSILAY